MSKILYTHHTENEKSNVIQNGRGHQSYCTYCLAGVFFFFLLVSHYRQGIILFQKHMNFKSNERTAIAHTGTT